MREKGRESKERRCHKTTWETDARRQRETAATLNSDESGEMARLRRGMAGLFRRTQLEMSLTWFGEGLGE